MKANKAVATPEYIGDVMNGRRTTIPLQREPDPSLPLALWVDGADQPTCYLQITDCHDDGEGWTVQVCAWVFEEPVRLLRAGSPLTGGGKARLMSARKRKFKDVRAKAPNGNRFTDEQAVGYTDRLAIALSEEFPAIDIKTLDPRWARRAARRHLEAISANASREERSRRARALGRRVRELALHDPALTQQIESLVREAEQKAA